MSALRLQTLELVSVEFLERYPLKIPSGRYIADVLRRVGAKKVRQRVKYSSAGVRVTTPDCDIALALARSPHRKQFYVH